MSSDDLAERDRRHCWHPFTQAATAVAPLTIVRGAGAYLYDSAGREYLDAASSWWVNLHGHGHPAIAGAIAHQAHTLEHTMFAGITHPPAVALAERLAQLAPGDLQYTFFSDNGSTAVEVAVKIACQYWLNRGTPRRRLLAFAGGYHGDTFGAMAVGRSSGFYTPFAPWLFDVDFVPYAATWQGQNPTATENAALTALDQHLAAHADDTAAFVFEPVMQGAAGMRLARPAFVRQVVARCRAAGLLIIADEVMTGFGRTGPLFACAALGDLTPDLLCLSKGLTGGFLPMGATLATTAIHEAFAGPDMRSAFLHGHSYTANPLGCAAALASLALSTAAACDDARQTLNSVHRQETARLQQHPAIEKIRICGTIAAFDIKTADRHYGSAFSQTLRLAFQSRGVLVRPLNNTLYFMPPYCTTAEQLIALYRLVPEVLEGLPHAENARSDSPAGTGELF
ncbi:MAG: adenosylmethionine--8-amino-7-oxononanoate transaminase [Burkholderiaceae bacterium]